MQLRDNIKGIKHPNCWSFFGGGIESNESPEIALKRELVEELNWKPTNYKYRGKIEYNRKIEIYYFSVQYDENVELILNEGKEMKWFTKKEIKGCRNLAPNIFELINILKIEFR